MTPFEKTYHQSLELLRNNFSNEQALNIVCMIHNAWLDNTITEQSMYYYLNRLIEFDIEDTPLEEIISITSDLIINHNTYLKTWRLRLQLYSVLGIICS